MNSTGDRIKKYRKEKGLTQQQLADSIGKSKSIIQKYEANNTNVNINILQEIAEVLDVKLHALLYDNESDSFKEFEREEELLDFANKTSEKIDTKLLELNAGVNDEKFLSRMYQLLEALDIEFIYDEYKDLVYLGNCYTQPTYNDKSDKTIITNTENFLFMIKSIISIRNNFFRVNKTSELNIMQLIEKTLENCKINQNTELSKYTNSECDFEVDTIAAHNDYLDEEGEMENIIKDLEDMDKWQ